MRQSLFKKYIFERLIKHSKGTHLIDIVKMEVIISMLTLRKRYGQKAYKYMQETFKNTKKVNKKPEIEEGLYNTMSNRIKTRRQTVIYKARSKLIIEQHGPH